jgi:prepilin-type processing-associated H-X9-DG protein
MSDFVRPGPAKTITFIEEDPRSLNDGTFAFVGPRDPPHFYMVDWPLTSHDVAGGVAFADGHVEMHRWVDNRTVIKSNASVAAQLGSQDILWLSERVSALVVKQP